MEISVSVKNFMADEELVREDNKRLSEGKYYFPSKMLLGF